MKTLTLVLGMLIAPLTSNAQESMRPRVASQFGKQIVVQAEFVAKSNDYYSQNMVAEPYSLKVFAVDGQSLKQPIVIEYRLELEKQNRPKIERPDRRITFEAYESVYQSETPWRGPLTQGRGFSLVPILYIRLPQSKG